MRPLNAEHRVWVHGQELVVSSAPPRGLGLFLGMFVFFTLVVTHVVTTLQEAVAEEPGYWRPAGTFALLVAHTGWVSGGWL